MCNEKEFNEWNQLHFPNQKERLIVKATENLDKIVNISNLNELDSEITIAKKFDHYISLGRAGYKEINSKIILTNKGLVENYYDEKTINLAINFLKIPIGNKYIPQTRPITKDLFSQIVESYKISPSKLNVLFEELKF